MTEIDEYYFENRHPREFSYDEIREIIDDAVGEALYQYDITEVEPLRKKIEELKGEDIIDDTETTFPLYSPNLSYLSGQKERAKLLNKEDYKERYWVILYRLMHILEDNNQIKLPESWTFMFSGEKMVEEDFQPLEWLGQKNHCVYLFCDLLQSRLNGTDILLDLRLNRTTARLFGLKNVAQMKSNYGIEPNGGNTIKEFVQIAFDDDLWKHHYPETNYP